MEFWFQSESGHAYRELAALHRSNADRTYVRHVAEPDGRIGIVRGSSIPLYSDAKVSMNTPHHLAVWYESGTDTTYLMIDGVVQQDTYSGNLLAVNDPKVYVGAYQYGSSVKKRFLGELDEVALYAGAVDASTFSGRFSESVIDVTYGFTYDANGNRTVGDDGSTITDLTYQPFSNRLAAIDGVALQHDTAGNRTADLGGTRTFSYNDAGRLSEVFSSGVSIASYAHNALGQRTTKTIGAGTTVYLYDLFGHLIAEHDQNGGHIRDYVWLDDTPIAQIDQGEVFSYLHFDHLGTPRLATNDNQTIVWRWDSDAFGTTAANEDPDGDIVATTINLRFPGQYYDQETGLHYNYFRTYDPSTGRYLESDPIGLQGGLNTYGYAAGNPLLYIDPYGLDFFDPVFGAIYWATDGWSPAQSTVDFSAGLGDALLLGQGQWLRDLAGVDGGVNKCSDAYDYGSYAAFAAGGSRLAYAGLAKGGSLLASSGAQASAFRQSLKTFFRGGFGRNWRPPNLTGKTDAQLHASAGKTNFGINAYGAGVATAAAAGAAECGCEQ